jgi:hypothetical protein
MSHDHEDLAETNVENAQLIGRRIVLAIGVEPLADVLGALVDVIAFEMSLVCPDCRENIARALIEHVPLMLREANSASATYTADDEPHQRDHHH